VRVKSFVSNFRLNTSAAGDGDDVYEKLFQTRYAMMENLHQVCFNFGMMSETLFTVATQITD